MDNCLRCGRPLTSEKSKSLGYGQKCYRIISLSKPVNDTKDDISFLKMEIKLIKREISKLNSGVIHHDIDIKRIKENVEPVRTSQQQLKGLIHQELKTIFNDPNWKQKILTSVSIEL